MDTRVELNVDVKDAEKLKATISNIPNTKIVILDASAGKLVVDGSAISSDILENIRSSGVSANIHGISSSQGSLGTAVSVLGGKGGWEMGCGGASTHEVGSESVKGVIRFMQSAPSTTIVESSLYGLKPGPHKVAIHEFGDISDGCNAVGEIFRMAKLGNLSVNSEGVGKMKVALNGSGVPDLLGRSVVVSDSNDKKLICGIISRAAGVMENTKTVCPCSPAT